MNVDRLCYFFVLSLLPLLWLPRAFLIGGVGLGIFCLLFGIWRRMGLLILLGGLITFSYVQVEHIAKKSENLTAPKQKQQVQIIQILRQQSYQTAIAEDQNGQRLYLNWQAKTPLQLHRQYLVQITPRPLSSRLNEGNFNRQKWYFAQHIQGTATVKKAEILPQTISLPFRTVWLNRVKNEIRHLSSQGLLLALAFGERAWLNAEDWQVFQQTSTAHIIAISGLHIALAFSIGFWLAKGGIWLVLRHSKILQGVRFPQQFAIILGLFFAWYYSFLAGFAIPTWRALIAIVVVLLCQFQRRHHTPWQLWWRVVALLLLLDPISLLSDSFWLSILAVASLISWYQFFPLAQWKWLADYKKWHFFPRLLISLIHLQLGIWLIFSPIQLFFFEGVSPFALLANLIIVPLYSFLLVPLVLLSLLTDNLLYSWQIADWLAQRSVDFLTLLSDAWLTLSISSQWWLLSLNLLILLLIYGLIWQKARFYWLLVSIIVLMFNRSMVIINSLTPPPIAQWLNFDVGQGLAMALVYQTSGQKKAILYDTGASWQGGSFIELELLPYFRREGIDVTHIFISHEDNDHVGGREDLLKAYPKAMLISSSEASLSMENRNTCLAGKMWQFGQTSLHAIYPTALAKRVENKDSCVIKVEIGQFKLLWTGDSGVAEERQYAQGVGKIDFLQVGHHGSRTSTSQTLLAHTEPSYAVISAGRWNPWKHPHQQIVERLHQYQSQSLNTAEVGMIRVDFFSEYYKIHTARNLFSPWYSRFIP